MKLPLHIAIRYLFAKKNHNVINIISIISAAGIAIGSMALIVILSVYNGFDNSIKSIYESYQADYILCPTTSKFLSISDSSLLKISKLNGIKGISKVIEENVFIKYGNNSAIASVHGVDSNYLKYSSANKNIVEGEFKLNSGQISNSVVSQQLSHNLGLRVRFVTPLEVYYPNKTSQISLLNPFESLKSIITYPSAIVSLNAENEGNIVFAQIDTVKNLLGAGKNIYSKIEIYLVENRQADINEIKNLLPDDISLKNKLQQNETLYKMMKAEKFAVYLILFFVILIISINIFSSLSMLIIDKGSDIETYTSLGATKKTIQKIFQLHGFLISTLGCMIGIIIGVILSLIQQHFKIITVPGNYLINAYPISISILDIIITFVGVCLIGYIISYIPTRKFFKN